MEIKDFKMVVTPEQSVIVQEFLFKNGYSWANGSTNVTEYPFINIVLDFNFGKLSYWDIDELDKSIPQN